MCGVGEVLTRCIVSEVGMVGGWLVLVQTMLSCCCIM